MKKYVKPSIEIINAFVDGELCDEERNEILSAMEHDIELNKDICELQKLKHSIDSAYPEEKFNSKYDNVPSLSLMDSLTNLFYQNRYIAAFATLTAIMVGVLFFSIQPQQHQLKSFDNSLVENTSNADNYRILIQLTQSDPEAINNMLVNVEELFKGSLNKNNKLQVKIIAHGEGLKFLRKDTTVFSNRIAAMSSDYANLTFAGCNNTITRVQENLGKKIELIPEADYIESGVAHVIKLQKEGWTYIRV